MYNKILLVVAKMKEQGSDPGAFLAGFGIQGGRAIQQIEMLSQKYAELQKNLDTAQNATGGADAFNATQMDEFKRATNELSTAWEELKTQVGGDLVGPVTIAFKGLAGVLELVTGLLDELSPATRTVMESLVVLAPAALAAAKAGSLLKEAVGGVGEVVVARHDPFRRHDWRADEVRRRRSASPMS